MDILQYICYSLGVEYPTVDDNNKEMFINRLIKLIKQPYSKPRIREYVILTLKKYLYYPSRYLIAAIHKCNKHLQYPDMLIKFILTQPDNIHGIEEISDKSVFKEDENYVKTLYRIPKCRFYNLRLNVKMYVANFNYKGKVYRIQIV
jgi:hypothetical protein